MKVYAKQVNTEQHSPKQVKIIDVIDVDILSSPDPSNHKSCEKEFLCIACYDPSNHNDLVNCKSCKMQFCATCISSNFGEEHLLEAKSAGWHCYSCSPVMLHLFVIDCDKVLGTFPASGSGSDSEFSDTGLNVPMRSWFLLGAETIYDSTSKRRKKKIRRILDDTELGEETKEK